MNRRHLFLCATLFLSGPFAWLRAQLAPTYPSTKASGLITAGGSTVNAVALGNGLTQPTASGDSQSVSIGSAQPGPNSAQTSAGVYADFGYLRSSSSTTAQYGSGTAQYQGVADTTAVFHDQIRFDNPSLQPGQWIDVVVSLGLSQTHSLSATGSNNGAGASVLASFTLKLGSAGDTSLLSPAVILTNSVSDSFDSLHGLAPVDPPTFYDSVTFHFQNGYTYSFSAELQTNIVANAAVTAGGSFASSVLDASHTGTVGFQILTAGSSYTTASHAGYAESAASAIPEPSTSAALAGAVALGLTLWRRRTTAGSGGRAENL